MIPEARAVPKYDQITPNWMQQPWFGYDASLAQLRCPSLQIVAFAERRVSLQNAPVSLVCVDHVERRRAVFAKGN